MFGSDIYVVRDEFFVHNFVRTFTVVTMVFVVLKQIPKTNEQVVAKWNNMQVSACVAGK